LNSGRTYQNLSIVIPAFNEETGLGATLDTVLPAFPEAEIIVVDDCSTDGTSAVARQRPVRLLRHAYNCGQGAALKTGMLHATRDLVAWFDADNEHRPQDLARLVDHADMIHVAAAIGQRRGPSASLSRHMGKWLIRLIGRGLKINAGSDLNCGLRLFRRSVILPYLPLIPDRFSASLVTTLVMIERRYPIIFEPIETNPRIGNSTVRIKDGFDAILVLIRSVLLFAPMRFFLPLGGGLIAIGIIYSLVVAHILGLGLPVAGGLLIMIGLFAVILGLIADQISQMRLGQLPARTPVQEIDTRHTDR
jgi:glycosyltransferase involved in cell wall biosynthesis